MLSNIFTLKLLLKAFSKAWNVNQSILKLKKNLSTNIYANQKRIISKVSIKKAVIRVNILRYTYSLNKGNQKQKESELPYAHLCSF